MDERTRDRHSVGCYFCGVEFDERDGQNADDYNNGDGGSICPACLWDRHVITTATADKDD